MMTFVKGRQFTEEHKRKLRENHRGMLGREHSKKTKEKVRRTKLGEKNPMFGKTPWNKGKAFLSENLNPFWKGDDVGYFGLHLWVYRQLGRPTKCSHCGRDGLTHHKIHWANISRQYKRNVTDWIRLCASCHKRYDSDWKAAHLYSQQSEGGIVEAE